MKQKLLGSRSHQSHLQRKRSKKMLIILFDDFHLLLLKLLQRLKATGSSSETGLGGGRGASFPRHPRTQFEMLLRMNL